MRGAPRRTQALSGALRSTQGTQGTQGTQPHQLAHSLKEHSEAQSTAINGMIEAFTCLPPLTKRRNQTQSDMIRRNQSPASHR